MSDERSAIEQAQADVERLTRERDEAREKYQWMVDHAADQKLDGYRELGAKCAELERERDEALRLHSVLHDCASEAQHMHTLLRHEHSCAVDAINAFRARAANAERDRDAERADHAVTKASCTDTTLRLMEALRERDEARAELARRRLVSAPVDVEEYNYVAAQAAEAAQDANDLAKEL